MHTGKKNEDIKKQVIDNILFDLKTEKTAPSNQFSSIDCYPFVCIFLFCTDNNIILFHFFLFFISLLPFYFFTFFPNYTSNTSMLFFFFSYITDVDTKNTTDEHENMLFFYWCLSFSVLSECNFLFLSFVFCTEKRNHCIDKMKIIIIIRKKRRVFSFLQFCFDINRRVC